MDKHQCLGFSVGHGRICRGICPDLSDKESSCGRENEVGQTVRGGPIVSRISGLCFALRAARESALLGEAWDQHS